MKALADQCAPLLDDPGADGDSGGVTSMIMPSAADVEPNCRARRGFVAAHARRSASTAAYASAAARLCSPSVRDAAICP